MSSDPSIGQYVPDPLVGAVTTIRAVGSLAVGRNLTFLAAGIAFYALVSIIPLVLLTLAVASFVGGEALAGRVSELLSQQLSDAGQTTVSQALIDPAGRGAASLVGFIGLTWSALNVFRGLDQAFDELYLGEVDTSLPEQVRNSLVVIVGIGLAVGLVFVIDIALSLLPSVVPFTHILGSLLLLTALGLAFLPIYYVLPPVDLSMRDVLPGAAVAAGGWVLLQIGIQIYAVNASRYGVYGIVGAILLFVTWLYFAGIVVLLGAAVNAVLGEVSPETG